MRTETVIWTALPNGVASFGVVKLSVFVSPQLQTNEVANPTLSLFPDFVNWPKTLQAHPVKFTVNFAGYPSVTVPANTGATSPPRWAALFNPLRTGVTNYKYTDYSSFPLHSYDSNGVYQYVSNLYTQMALNNPSTPPVITTSRGTFGASGINGGLFTQIKSLTGCGAGGYNSNLPSRTRSSAVVPEDVSLCAPNSYQMGQAVAFHVRTPASPPGTFTPPPVPTLPTLDFHQAVSALGSFPAVLRNLGLVYDLMVPLPAALQTANTTVNVTVTPSWTSAFNGAGGHTTVNVPLATQAILNKAVFRPKPVGPDYTNGMLNLADTSRFSVFDVDLDGAAEQTYNMSKAIQNIATWQEPLETDGAELAMTVPALRSTGPSITWRGWGSGFNNLLANQTSITNAVEAWVSWRLAPQGSAPPLPVLHAEDVIRGHRFDVLPTSDTTPVWRSLHQRVGTYRFGNQGVVHLPESTGGIDEGVTEPTPTQAAGMPNPAPDLYLNESIVTWPGWSLAAPRPGPQINPDDSVGPNPGNPASTTPNALNQITPQLSASFTVPKATLAKLRYGRVYRYRARGVDLAGNSLPVTSTDASTATGPTIHLRYEPVSSPVMAQIKQLGPGEGTHLVSILNYGPGHFIQTNGRWLFPPRVSEMTAERHGMLDGLTASGTSNPNQPLSPTSATYQMLAGTATAPGRADATLADVAGVQYDPNNGSPFFAINAVPVTPWLPDPLARGVAFNGFPGEPPTVRTWTGGPWPGFGGLLMALTPGGVVSHTYTAGTTTTPPVERVTLPPAGVLNLNVSSALQKLTTLGVLYWIALTNPSPAEAQQLTDLAVSGQMWMISPYKTLRMVHAVLFPLTAPGFVAPVVDRNLGATFANIFDPSFSLDAPSTVEIDAMASWTDPVDDPTDPANDPTTATVTTTGHAFKAHVPDPEPLGPINRPMEVVSPPEVCPLVGAPGVVHHIGDTMHHTVAYTSTASSRFAEFFEQDQQVMPSGTTPVPLNSAYNYPIDPQTVVVTLNGKPLDLSPDGVAGDYVLNGNTLALVPGSPYSGDTLSVSFIPSHTTTGAPVAIELLSTAPPKAPKVARISPAWSVNGPFGGINAGISYARYGGMVRVYLERPWYSSGKGELLGVVALPGNLGGQVNKIPADTSPGWVTMMGLDPISANSGQQVVPVSPNDFGSTASVPSVPYRPAYQSPPLLPLLENPGGTEMCIWPYQPAYDPEGPGYWYADIDISASGAIDGPPPGHFVRLALVRFQPYSVAGAEISPVTLCTFAQPVPDRFVSVVAHSPDPTKMSVNVSVSGPGYYGWRPPMGIPPSEVQPDYRNPYAPHPYSTQDEQRASSTMVVEVQIQDTSSGLSGDLAWQSAPGLPPVMLQQSFDGNGGVSWDYFDVGGAPAPIELPAAIGSAMPMRLRISELDYYPFLQGAPSVVNTSQRRPFVAHIPIN